MPLVHNGDALTELIGLLHIVCCQPNGDAALAECANALPEEEARLRVQVVGWLVEEKYLRLVHQRTRQHHTLLQASRKPAQLLFPTRAQAKLLKQGVSTRCAFGPRHAMIGGMIGQDLADA